MTSYLRTLRKSLVGDPEAPLVLLCNFEVERQWAVGHVGLPGVAVASAPAVVQRMEQLGALLAGPDDFLVLKHPLDDGYRKYVEDLGFAPPTVLVPENVVEERSTTEDVLDSPRLLATLAALGRRGARLLPMGASAAEQKIAESCSLPLAGADAATAERVNGKIYGRRLAGALGLREIPGHCCETVADLETALADLAPDHPLVVKDAYGVSGRGLVVVDSPTKAAGLLRMVGRRAAKTGDNRLEVVVEEWIDRRFDLNYQLTVAGDGAVKFDFVKAARTEGGVHKGHIMPPELEPAQLAEIEHAALEVGAALHRDGFVGVAGVDAIVSTAGTLYPVLEINARLNMSTYQGSVVERAQRPGHAGLARHYTLRLGALVAFDQVREALDRVERPEPTNIVVTCFGTLNAGAPALSGAVAPAPGATAQESFNGRLYVMLFAPDRTRLTDLDGRVQRALAGIPDVQEVR